MTSRKSSPTSKSTTRSSRSSRASRTPEADALGPGASTLRFHHSSSSAATRVVLGIDPGTRRAGFAVLATSQGRMRSRILGTIELPVGEPLVARLARLGEEMTALLRQHRPDEVSIEQAIYAQNVRTALALGQARGVLLYAAASAGLTVHEYSPREVKRAVSGNGNASKEQVQGMVRRLLGLSGPPQADAADAAAIALCHLLRPSRVRPVSGPAARDRAIPAAGRRRSSRWTEADVVRLLGTRILR